MIHLIQNQNDYENDIRAMIMAFYPGVKISEKVFSGDEVLFSFRVLYGEGETLMTVCSHAAKLLEEKERRESLGEETDGARFDGPAISADGCDKPDDLHPIPELPYFDGRLFISSCGYRAKLVGDYRDRDKFKNLLKMGAYRILGQLADKRLPWGDMTGVRPTKVAMKKLRENMAFSDVVRHYQRVYDASERKATLATTVAAKELELVRGMEFEKSYCLYVGIPFCPTRCLYCSFTSYPIGKNEERAGDYMDKLCEELEFIERAYHHKKLVAVYVGGGTPTSISHELLDVLFSKIKSTFSMEHVREFTVEAGRPDSITKEKLQVMKRHGVSRISINPQTMNDETLLSIGRAHTTEDVKTAFALARAEGFDNINMDLIAGLPGESLENMRHTLEEVRKLAPESVTVHSLAVKRAANLKRQMSEYEGEIHRDMDDMLNLVGDVCGELGMEPYYLYRQKNIGGNLENVGYAKKGRECLYNVLIMEELTDIIAAGAGGATKLVFPAENRIERVENCKSVDDYMGRFEEMLERKSRGWDGKNHSNAKNQKNI